MVSTNHTVTVDNGKEFAQFAHYEQITKLLGINVYFAHPYSSWERGFKRKY
jgi:IS30 family transposase